jgi:hypothetical protein
VLFRSTIKVNVKNIIKEIGVRLQEEKREKQENE